MFYHIGQLPFHENNFAKPYTDVWSESSAVQDSAPKPDAFNNMLLTIRANGNDEAKFVYSLTAMYRALLKDEDDDEIDTDCTILVFALQD